MLSGTFLEHNIHAIHVQPCVITVTQVYLIKKTSRFSPGGTQRYGMLLLNVGFNG